MRSPQCGGIFSDESWPSDKEVPGHPDPEITGGGGGGGGVKKDFFSALQASVWSKNSGASATDFWGTPSLSREEFSKQL